MLGILIINKPYGITSHDVISKVRKKLNLRRVGHAGTLDPLATGILVVAVGKATRILQYLNLEPKRYEGRVTFGIVTDTQDIQGKILKELPVPQDLEEKIKEALSSFQGEILQVPPMYSAVKIKGKPLYKYARAGEELEREPRPVKISKFEVSLLEKRDAHFSIECSSGTYVRTLLHDLGQAIGCGAIMTELTRVGAGPFSLENAVFIEDVTQEKLIPLEKALCHYTHLSLDETRIKKILQGQSIAIPEDKQNIDTLILKDTSGTVLAIGKLKNESIQPVCILT